MAGGPFVNIRGETIEPPPTWSSSMVDDLGGNPNGGMPTPSIRPASLEGPQPAYVDAGLRTQGMDPRIYDIVSSAGYAFSKETGFEVVAFSGVDPRASGTSNHPGGWAIDVRLIDQNGTVLANSPADAKRRGQDLAENFRAYEAYAQTARDVQLQKYPELAQDFRWGGYFVAGDTPFDLMHFDINPNMHGATGGGDWENGLSSTGKKLLPGAESIGMTPQVTQKLNDLGYKGPNAVQQYQAANGLTPDGKVGPQTLGALNQQLRPPANIPDPNAQIRAATIGSNPADPNAQEGSTPGKVWKYGDQVATPTPRLRPGDPIGPVQAPAPAQAPQQGAPQATGAFAGLSPRLRPADGAPAAVTGQPMPNMRPGSAPPAPSAPAAAPGAPPNATGAFVGLAPRLRPGGVAEGYADTGYMTEKGLQAANKQGAFSTSADQARGAQTLRQMAGAGTLAGNMAPSQTPFPNLRPPTPNDGVVPGYNAQLADQLIGSEKADPNAQEGSTPGYVWKVGDKVDQAMPRLRPPMPGAEPTPVRPGSTMYVADASQDYGDDGSSFDPSGGRDVYMQPTEENGGQFLRDLDAESAGDRYHVLGN